jgi:hypothetical protein
LSVCHSPRHTAPDPNRGHGTHFFGWSQSIKPPYIDNGVSGSFSDYNELALQFGYVVLFAPAFPLAPALALLSNIVENRIDGLKLFISFQKPVYHGAHDMYVLCARLPLSLSLSLACTSTHSLPLSLSLSPASPL